MKAGRPPSWNPVASLTASTWTEVVPLTSKSRLQLPAQARLRLSWSRATEPLALLARVEPNGHAQLLPWVPVGDAILRSLDQLLTEEDEASRGRLVLIAMDRYVRVTLEPDGRMSLPVNLEHHLDATLYGAVRVVVDTGKLFLWSEGVWQRNRSDRLASVEERLRELEAAADKGAVDG